jgi:hypothetical protein
MADDQNKYNLVLELVNKILVNIGESPINELDQFKNIQREKLLNESNLTIIEEMENDLFKYFDKKKSGYYRKTETKVNHVINFLRGLCKQINYKIYSIEKSISIEKDGKKYYCSSMFFSIIKN